MPSPTPVKTMPGDDAAFGGRRLERGGGGGDDDQHRAAEAGDESRRREPEDAEGTTAANSDSAVASIAIRATGAPNRAAMGGGDGAEEVAGEIGGGGVPAPGPIQPSSIRPGTSAV